jgi:uncharacterized RDD family membrane protein YckC
MILYTVHPKPYLKLKSIATLIDYGIYFIVFYIYVCVFNENPGSGDRVVTNGMTLPLVLFWFIYFVLIEAFNQATVGHDICKLRVFKEDASKPPLGDIFKRRLLDPIDIFFYGIPAFICISKTPKHQRIGDIWAGTVVVKISDITKKEVIF